MLAQKTLWHDDGALHIQFPLTLQAQASKLQGEEKLKEAEKAEERQEEAEET